MRSTATATLLLLAGTASAFSVNAPAAPVAPVSGSRLAHQEVDADAAFATSTFPISPDDLTVKCKSYLAPDVLIGTKDGGACLGEDFEFVAAVVGPIPKEEYLSALDTFKLEDSFDTNANWFGFNVDPLQPNRVWFFGRSVSQHTNDFMGAKPEDTKDGGVLTLPPQVFHMDFNEDGKIKEFGFYTADRRQGNTGGLGGAFAYFWGVNRPLPIRECQPYQPSFRFRMLNLVGRLGKRFSKK